jgi:hypothetical protein
MRFPLHSFFVSMAGLALILNGGGRLSAADPPDSKRVHFTTYDEVELSGNLYPSAPTDGKRDKEAVVLLLHDFKHAEGGGSRLEGWIDLAVRLQKEGYTVLTFDFRGFGDSKSVSENFWRVGNNKGARARGVPRKPPATIDQKEFDPRYYLTLVNDIAAARAFLDTQNDAGNVNSSNIIVIGAGQGAALGALWTASECRRQRDPISDNLRPGMLPQWGVPFKKFDSPEGNDIAATVWLTISPSVEKCPPLPLRACLADTARTAKIPTCFLYGQTDEKAAGQTKSYLDYLQKERGRMIELKGVKAEAVRGTHNLAGAKLLGRQRQTANTIVKFVNKVIDDRGTRTRKDRQNKKYAFCWTVPWPEARGAEHLLAKMPGEEVPRLIPLRAMGMLGR